MTKTLVKSPLWMAFALIALWRLAQSPACAEVLQAEGELQWRRGNMHTHSLWSDGDDYLEMIALWYREHNYNFLVFTDHNVLADSERWINVEQSKGGMHALEKLKSRLPDAVQERTKPEGELEVRLNTFQEVSERLNAPHEFLLIQGEEISDRFEEFPVHLNVSNVTEVMTPTGGSSMLETMQANVRAAIQRRKQTGRPMMIHLNHPNFGYAITAEDLARVVGEQFFEVYNGHPNVGNHGDQRHVSVERLWDIVLTLRLVELKLPLMYGLATDDGHQYHNIPSRASEPGRGWVMVLTDELSAKSLIGALEAGRFYSSSGVMLKRIESTPAALSIEVEPVEGEQYTIDFIGTRAGYDPASEPVMAEPPQADDEPDPEDQAESTGQLQLGDPTITDEPSQSNEQIQSSEQATAKGQPDAEAPPRELHTTRRYSPDVGEVLDSVQGPRAVYRFQGDEIYVRARVTSSAMHRNPSQTGDLKQAWCQPLVGPASGD